jgi:flavin reductase (DIM6/NTAB) family NADH-FMN oxidoreductase RutF
MFFTPGTHKDHGLTYSPLKAIVCPRPIGWISSIDNDGRSNLAPYSFFNAISELPPMVGYSSSPGEFGDKDSLINIRETKQFVVNIVSAAQTMAMNASSAALPHGDNEFDFAGLTPIPSELVLPPRVKDAPCHLECELWDILPLPEMPNGQRNHWVMGTIIGIHIDDSVITDGRVDVLKFNPVARLGYKDYAQINDVFEIDRPGASKEVMR